MRTANIICARSTAIKAIALDGRKALSALLIACADDTMVSAGAAAECAAMIGEKARLVVLPIDHFDVYHGRWFERGCSEQIAFFHDALGSAHDGVRAVKAQDGSAQR